MYDDETKVTIALAVFTLIAMGIIIVLITLNSTDTRYLNECASCGAYTVDRYPTHDYKDDIVWICPHCDEELRNS